MSLVSPGQAVGTSLDGRYRLDRIAGSGAFGVVYEAHHLALDAKVAVKVLHPPAEGRDLAAAVSNFLEESRVLRRLHHPNIVAALDAGTVGQTPYYVMDWCDGPTLQALVDRPRTIAEAWALLRPVFEAIAHAHRQGIVHRDLKPSNLVIVDGAPRVVDFGIAKMMAPGETAGTGETFTTGRVAFTPRYAAPEQLAGGRTGPWTDVHALGLLVVEVVAGRPAVRAERELLDPTRPTPKVHGIRVGAVEDVLARALALRPRDRFADAGAFLTAMDDAITAPARRARMPLALAVGALSLIGVATGVGLHAMRATTARAPSPSASASASTTADRRSPPLHHLGPTELKARVDGLGLASCGLTEDARGTSIACLPGVRIMLGSLASMGYASEAGREDILDNLAAKYDTMLGSGDESGMVAIDGDRYLSVVAPPDALAHVYGAVVAGDSVERARAVGTPVLPAMSAAARSALQSWTPIDALRRVREVGPPRANERQSQQSADVDIGEAKNRAHVSFAVTNAPRATLSFLRTHHGPVAYAITGDHLLAVAGDPKYAREAFVQSLLGGAHAEEIGVVP